MTKENEAGGPAWKRQVAAKFDAIVEAVVRPRVESVPCTPPRPAPAAGLWALVARVPAGQFPELFAELVTELYNRGMLRETIEPDGGAWFVRATQNWRSLMPCVPLGRDVPEDPAEITAADWRHLAGQDLVALLFLLLMRAQRLEWMSWRELSALAHDVDRAIAAPIAG
jgi:hypothetical protein